MQLSVHFHYKKKYCIHHHTSLKIFQTYNLSIRSLSFALLLEIKIFYFPLTKVFFCMGHNKTHGTYGNHSNRSTLSLCQPLRSAFSQSCAMNSPILYKMLCDKDFLKTGFKRLRSWSNF